MITKAHSESDILGASYDSFQEQEDSAPRLFDEAAALDIIERIKKIADTDNDMYISVQSWWGGAQRWARNYATMTSDQRNVSVWISIKIKGLNRALSFNQTDDNSLKNAVDYLYKSSKSGSNIPDAMWVEKPTFVPKGKSVWSDATFNRKAEENGRAVYNLTQKSEAEGLLSAGFIGTVGARILNYSRTSYSGEQYGSGEASEIQCSCTVRHPKGTGSGWAGNSSFDLQRVDMARITEIAFDKCVRSLDPVRLEPGRYQTILEPQATAVFAEQLVLHIGNRISPEAGYGVFTLGGDAAISRYRTKLGLQVVDKRINIYHDPEDPISGTHPSSGMDAFDMIKDGVLVNFANDFEYSAREFHTTDFHLFRSSFVMKGGSTSTEEMISDMERGLVVTRFSGVEVLPGASGLMTGLTRDGLWLVERGKITKAVRNFRWTESPFFIFNNVEKIGEAVPIFNPGEWQFPFRGAPHEVVRTVVVPTIKIKDFSFTSTIDAV